MSFYDTFVISWLLLCVTTLTDMLRYIIFVDWLHIKVTKIQFNTKIGLLLQYHNETLLNISSLIWRYLISFHSILSFYFLITPHIGLYIVIGLYIAIIKIWARWHRHYDLCPVDSCFDLLSALDSGNGVMGVRISPHLGPLLINNNPYWQQLS